jgi:hypothetical protein
VFAAVAGERWLEMSAGRCSDRDVGNAQLWGIWVDIRPAAGALRGGCSPRSGPGRATVARDRSLPAIFVAKPLN